MSPASLEALLAEPTAVVTCEMERGVVGDLAGANALARAVHEHGVLDAAGRLATAARAADVRVVHALVEMRADRAGMAINTPLLEAVTQNPDQILEGSPQAELVPELGPAPEDLLVRRIHGLTPFTGTELDPVLRNLGVRTIVPAGVSVNEALLGLCLTAADLGYRLALPTDAVGGVPEHYVKDVIKYSLAALATLCTVDDIVAVWRS